ncbi:hypothetical protein NMY22_g10381 [Coprinellus aureogranulatus]|nr:hypothetical protein NMY22_g10381 [Coprinellus aureogranulatus]
MYPSLSCNLGRKTSLIDLDDDWMLEPEERNGNSALLINLDSSSPPKSTHTPNSPSKKPYLPTRKPSYSSLKSVGSISSLHSSSSANANQTFLYPPRPRADGGLPLTVDTMELLNHKNNGGGRHTQASSISSFHSISLSSDTSTDVSTPGSISNFIATYPADSTDSLTESFEDVSATSFCPATERTVRSEFERAKAVNRSSTQTVTLPSATFSPPVAECVLCPT